MKARFAAGIILSLFFCIFAVADISAATLVVTKNADTTDGVCDADCSLREAVAAAVPDDTVLFSTLFNTPQTITLLNGQIAFSKNLTITGPGANLLTVSGNNANRIFHISGGAVVSMSGMKLTNGNETTQNDPNGGAIRLLDSTLTLTGMVLSDNIARFGTISPFGTGGAISSNSSTLSLTNSTVINNTSVSSGGLYSEGGTVNFTGCTMRTA